ncbi:MAG: FAD-dependent oxidoreductase [Candidatus Glassbacteria bacterium]|nr:FAD-dependent oxidoreductase [Candidatus Glassbacteria bacterium]
MTGVAQVSAGISGKYPCLVIGGGIIGSSVARELASRGRGPVVVLDKEPELGLHASGRNSATAACSTAGSTSSPARSRPAWRWRATGSRASSAPSTA